LNRKGWGIMDQIYGYSGKLLRIDLTNEKVIKENLDAATLRKWVGGTGLGAKYLFDEVPRGVDWSDAENRLILASGPLGGTAINGSGTVGIVTKGALTNGAAACQANGFFGAFLRFSGIDCLILQGKAKRWVYLSIHGDEVEFKDASALSGKDTWETNDLIRKELGATEHGVSVASIGPAGENLVRFAGIFFDKGHVASHNGVGAVMGSKQLKAIVIARGERRPVVQDKERLAAIAEQQFEIYKPVVVYSSGTLNGVISSVMAKDGTVPVKNYSTNVFDVTPEQLDKFSANYIRSHFDPKPSPCWACRTHHLHMITINEGPFKGCASEEPEYECLAAFGPITGITDAAATVGLCNEADRLGLDSNETGWTIGLAMECFEKGLLTTSDTGGLQLNWGNYLAVKELMHQITERKGFGAILAEGAMRAAQSIGKGAPDFALHTMKGNTPRGHDHRNNWPRLLDTCMSQMSSDEGYDVLKPQDIGLSLTKLARPDTSIEDTLKYNIGCKGAAQFEDSLGVCRFTTMTNMKLLCEAVSAVTGWDFTPNEGMEVGKRTVNLLRCFNIRHGHTADMDAPSPRYGSAPVDGPSKGISIMPQWNEMRSKYYEGMGWDKESGKPLPDTLKRYGLEYAINELWGRV
jgi:aldehyde:ferredoxin oxidoreductase